MKTWLWLEEDAPLPSPRALGEAEMLLLRVRPSRQRALLDRLAPTFKSGQIVVFQAGKLATLEFHEQTSARGVMSVETSGVLNSQEHRPVWLASSDPAAAELALGVLAPSFPNLTLARSPNECAFNDPAGIIHPAALLLNISRVEQMGPYRTAFWDITESVGRVLDALDRERTALGRALEWEVHPLAILLGTKPGSVFQAVRSTATWQSHMSPDSVDHPHFLEEIPYHIAPLVELAEERDVPVPLLRSVLLLAEAATGRSLKAKRRFLGTAVPEPTDSGDPDFGHSGLEEVATVWGNDARRLTLPGPPFSHERGTTRNFPGSDIAESFERLRQALEKKLSPD